MPSFLYDAGFKGLADGSIDWLTDVIKVMALENAVPYVPAQAEADMVTAALSELNAIGYVPGFAGSGRGTLGGKTLTQDTGTHRTKYDATDPAPWTIEAGRTVTGFIVYKHDTNDATSVPIAFIDIADTLTNGNPAPLVFDASGVFYVQL